MVPPSKILRPLNQTAKTSYKVPGNPTTTRPEDVVANCFPGLELDVRNLDRRFFPGLVFDFVTPLGEGDPSPIRQFGARLSHVDLYRDPDLCTDTAEARALFKQLRNHSDALGKGEWFLDWLEQGGNRVLLSDRFDKSPLDGLVVWRLVRSLEQGHLVIGLKRRDRPDQRGNVRRITLRAWRRRYTDPDTGVISLAYQAGELTQSLCSPWQHDFRDCACFYWASNHPDIVYTEMFPTEATISSGDPVERQRGNVRVDWLRSVRSPDMASAAYDTMGMNRKFQMDHLEINTAWQSLNVVLESTEIGALYTPAKNIKAEPFLHPADLANHIREHLAPLEMTLALEYLYAMFSLISLEEARVLSARSGIWRTLAEDVGLARQQLMLIAINEMQHLHWANRLLWELHREGTVESYTPVLRQATKVPSGDGRYRLHRLRRLTPKVLEEFIDLERPSSSIANTYDRVIATLREDKGTYPHYLAELAERINDDGMRHLSQFLRIKSALQVYASSGPPYPYLRKIRLGSLAETTDACIVFQRMIRYLGAAYASGTREIPQQSARHMALARSAMEDLLQVGERCAASGIGIRFRLPRK